MKKMEQGLSDCWIGAKAFFGGLAALVGLVMGMVYAVAWLGHSAASVHHAFIDSDLGNAFFDMVSGGSWLLSGWLNFMGVLLALLWSACVLGMCACAVAGLKALGRSIRLQGKTSTT